MATPPQDAYAREELAYRATWPAPGDTPPPASPRSLAPVSRQLSPAASSSTGLAEPLVVSATMLALVSAAAVQTALALLSVATAAAAAVGSESEDGPSAAALVVVPPHEAAAARGELINHSPSPSPVRALHASSMVHPSSSNLAADIARKLFVGKSAAAAWHEGSAWAAAEEDESDIDLPEKSQNEVSDSLHCLSVSPDATSSFFRLSFLLLPALIYRPVLYVCVIH